MGTYEELKAAIQQVITTNGNNEITGALLQQTLLSIVNTIGGNAAFAGIATPTTNPGTPDQNIFYLASEPGDYVNFNNITLNEGDTIVICNQTGVWQKIDLGFATQQQLKDETIFEEITKLELLENSYFGAMNKNVGDTYTSTITEGTGVAANKFKVKAGERYRLKGVGNKYAYRGYFITNGDNVITRMIGTDVEEYDVEIIIKEGETNLYVNCINYNSETQGVWQVVQEHVKEIVEEIRSNQESASIESTNILDNIIIGQAYNVGGNVVGQTYTSTPAQSATSAFVKTKILPNSKYYLRGVGSQYAFRFYFVLDKDNVILDIASGSFNTRNNPLELTFPENAYTLIVNFTNYDATLDSITVKTKYSLFDVLKPLSGFNIVCFGDSITQFDDSADMRYSDYLQIAGANVINVGIGGTQFRQRQTPSLTPASNNQAYAGLDIVSLIDAVVSENYDIPAASATYLENNTGVQYNPEEVIARLRTIDWSKINIVTFFAGTNDWFGGVELGVSSNFDKTKTLGAINYIIKELLTKYPHLHIFWFTPIVRYIASSLAERTEENWAGNYLTSEGKTLLDYVNAIHEVVKQNSIPVCDMYHSLGWNQYNFVEYFNDDDGTHPYKGFEEIATRMKKFILSHL